ncbi:MAG TPA: acyl-ACP thioesterase domain-containing protein [Rectinemataceae bacterium]|nr:acyl-ACP thioesterase domain-containing protein [Rectinemataceae bacterium]
MRKIEPHAIDYFVRGFDCGWGGPLQVLPMANFLQEAAGEHAVGLGFGIPELNAKGLTWMLVKADIRIDRLPRWGERIRARTWPSGLDRLLALRDIMLETEAGEPLVRAIYAYLVVDVEARRPVRPERALPELADIDVTALGHCVGDFRFGVEALEAPLRVAAFRQEACPRHRDDNGHVNNAHIIDWLVDVAPETVRGAGLAGMRIDFIKEVLVGEAVDLVHGGDGATADGSPATRNIVTEALRGDECVARAELAWRAE